MLDGLPLRKGEVVHSNNKMFAVFRRLGGPRRSQGLRLQHPDSTRLMMGPTRFASWAMSAFAVAIWGKADMTFCTAHVRFWPKADMTRRPCTLSTCQFEPIECSS